jgi:hypothetical protein
LTSAQFLAQLRRQLMGRPQATQGLLGSAALLPRKLGVVRVAIGFGDCPVSSR